jgi:hypothetical protein
VLGVGEEIRDWAGGDLGLADILMVVVGLALGPERHQNPEQRPAPEERPEGG